MPAARRDASRRASTQTRFAGRFVHAHNIAVVPYGGPRPVEVVVVEDSDDEIEEIGALVPYASGQNRLQPRSPPPPYHQRQQPQQQQPSRSGPTWATDNSDPVVVEVDEIFDIRTPDHDSSTLPPGEPTTPTPNPDSSARARRRSRNETRTDQYILTAWPSATPGEPKCDTCLAESRTCWRVSTHVKCLTCASKYCSLYSRPSRLFRQGSGPPQASTSSPTFSTTSGVALGATLHELFSVVALARQNTGMTRTYMVQRARRLATSLGTDLDEIVDDFIGEGEAGGSGTVGGSGGNTGPGSE